MSDQVQIPTHRPWGNYTVLVDESDHKVKTITVHKGQSISLQRHQMRDEYWTIVSGVGVMSLGYDQEDIEEELAKPGDTFRIDAGMIHRIKAGTTDLTFIEVQLGAGFDEKDIERLEDNYGRA